MNSIEHLIRDNFSIFGLEYFLIYFFSEKKHFCILDVFFNFEVES